jgi:hypothetical protein
MGFPTKTGNLWSKEEFWEAVAEGPHCSTLSPEAMAHFAEEAAEKVCTQQACIVAWDNIKDNPPKELKISLVAAIPDKLMAFCSILDLLLRLWLQNVVVLAAVNDTTEKMAPKGAIDQIRECLARVIHAFAEADESTKVFMAKWDIKDRFWRINCVEGEEWNFAYVLPQPEGEPIQLVVPTSLQMGWIDPSPYICAPLKLQRTLQLSTLKCLSIIYQTTNLSNTLWATLSTAHCPNLPPTQMGLHAWWRYMLMTL